MSFEMNKMEIIIRILCGVLMLAIFQPIIFTNDLSKTQIGDWQILFWFAFILILTAQYSTTPSQFFTGSGIVIIDFIKRQFGCINNNENENNNNGNGNEKTIGFWTLMPSAFITWIFAKSIQNASTLGAAYGILGSIAYAGWYVSFFSASIVIYYLRTRHNSSSLPATVQHLFGPIAQILFCLGLLYRLNNEVWSNALVVASFYGPVKSTSWWLAAIFSSVIPGIYVYLGGMRSSLISDVLQAFIAVMFLLIILFIMVGEKDYDADYEPEGGWELANAWQLLATALIQGTLSYPFHDPVLTDRCYLSDPKTMLLSFTVGGFISMIYITLFGLLGIYGQSTIGSGVPALIGVELGIPVLMNLVFLTSSMSTLDSTFTSTAKIIGLDIGGWFPQLRRYSNNNNNNNGNNEIGPLKLADIEAGKVNKYHVFLGRIGLVLMVIAGILPLLEETDALNATLVSGTTVMGLGPPIFLSLFWQYGNNGWRQSPLCFIFSFITGTVYGILYQIKDDYSAEFSENLRWGVDFGHLGGYTVLLGCNVWGNLLCFVAAFIGFILDQYVLKFGEFIEMEEKPLPNNNNNENDLQTTDEEGLELGDKSTNDKKPTSFDRVKTVESTDNQTQDIETNQ